MKELSVIDPKRKDRSPSFPFISLEYALERARQFFDAERRGSTVMSIAAKHWQYSPASSGVLQTIAALKSYGLVMDEGAGDQRKIRLTENALRIILDTRQDSEEKKRFIQQAALAPTVSSEIYRKWPDGLPSNDTLNHFLLLDKKFNEVTALKVCKIIQENHVFARIYSTENLSREDKIESDIETWSEETTNQKNIYLESIKPNLQTPPWQRNLSTANILVDDQPRGKQVGQSIPVTKNCSLSVIADGVVTQEGLDKLIAYLNLIKDSFPKNEDQVQQ